MEFRHSEYMGEDFTAIAKSPALIYRCLMDHAGNTIANKDTLANLDIIMDFHWFFLHSKKAKEQFNTKRHSGKWKYDATSVEDLIHKAKAILPLVASGDFPVAKFTNIANVFSGEKLIVVYCFNFGHSAKETGDIFSEAVGEDVYWGSDMSREDGRVKERV